MSQTTASRIPLEVCPNQAEVARMLRVTPGALLYASKTAAQPLKLDWQSAGGQSRLEPSEVLRAGLYFKRRPLTEVAARLVEHAANASDDDADRLAVKAEVTDWLRRFAPATPDRTRETVRATQEFLRQAKELLDPELYAQVERETLHGRSSIPNPRA